MRISANKETGNFSLLCKKTLPLYLSNTAQNCTSVLKQIETKLKEISFQSKTFITKVYSDTPSGELKMHLVA